MLLRSAATTVILSSLFLAATTTNVASFTANHQSSGKQRSLLNAAAAAASRSKSSPLLSTSSPNNGNNGSNNNNEATAEEEDTPVVYYNILSEPNPTPQEQQQFMMMNEAGDADYLPAAQAALQKTYQSYESTFSTNKAAAAATSINGWTPKDDYALWGLPGAIAPLGFFDPIGFAREGSTLNDAKRLREAEVQHGRVAMMACVGYIAGEAAAAVSGGGGPFHITGPANDQLQQVPAPAFAVLTAMIAAAELYRAQKGWVSPKFQIGSNTLWTLRDDYYPGDIGFDPLGLKPKENYAFQEMQTKELSNGRLAMLASMGFMAQELVNHRTIADTIDFYVIVFSGGNPYA